MISIQKNRNIVTLINIFTIEPQNQKTCWYACRNYRTNNEYTRGFISANIHKSLDGTKVVNYAQWKSRDVFEKMLNNSKVIVRMNDILNIAKSDGSLYDVVFTEEKL